jgi:hypothetical protein
MLQKTIAMLKQEATNVKEAADTDNKGLAKRIKERERKVQQLESKILDLEEEKLMQVEEANEKH